MTSLTSLLSPAPDISRLKQAGDIPSLVRLLSHADPSVQWHAAEALGTCGENAVPLLLQALHSPVVPVRLGATEALSAIRNPRAVDPLTNVIRHDTSLEVRLAAVIALGEIGSPEAIPCLVSLLRSPGRYLRYGAAAALGRLGWEPREGDDATYFLIARQDWEQVRRLGAAATPCLSEIFQDDDPVTREEIATILLAVGDPQARALCRTALKDRSPSVRWKSVLASMNCGLAAHDLPIMVAARERTGPDPAAAAILNFLFLGIGYNYMGKWWGFPLFMTFTISISLVQWWTMDPFLPYLIAYPVTAVIGVHSYFETERMSDL